MKHLMLSGMLVLLCIFSHGQTDMAKLSTEIKKLSGDWLGGFRNVKGAIKSESETQSIFYSRVRLSGSLDTSNLLYFTKDRQTWSFTAHFDRSSITASTLDSVIKEIDFAFGKVKMVSTNIKFANGYVPASKKGASDRQKTFYLLLTDRSRDPSDKSNGLISLTIGEEGYFWNK